MNYSAEYRSKLRTSNQAVKAVKSGDWVDYTTNLCFPSLLDEALSKRKEELHDVKIRGIYGCLQTEGDRVRHRDPSLLPNISRSCFLPRNHSFLTSFF